MMIIVLLNSKVNNGPPGIHLPPIAAPMSSLGRKKNMEYFRTHLRPRRGSDESMINPRGETPHTTSSHILVQTFTSPSVPQIYGILSNMSSANHETISLSEIPSHRSSDDVTPSEIEQPSLPPADGGKAAWLLLASCCLIQLPVWGVHSVRMTGICQCLI